MYCRGWLLLFARLKVCGVFLSDFCLFGHYMVSYLELTLRVWHLENMSQTLVKTALLYEQEVVAMGLECK